MLHRCLRNHQSVGLIIAQRLQLSSTHEHAIGSDEVRVALRRELYRLKENVDRSARIQFRRSAFWGGIGIAVNVLTALLAGAAGASSLSKVAGAIPAGLLALAAAALATVNTALSAEKGLLRRRPRETRTSSFATRCARFGDWIC
jgi:hypothetical protein